MISPPGESVVVGAAHWITSLDDVDKESTLNGAEGVPGLEAKAADKAVENSEFPTSLTDLYFIL